MPNVIPSITEYKVESMDNSDLCSPEEEFSRVPFRIMNLTTETWVQLHHIDEGLVQGIESADLAGADGRKDCFWSRSEPLSFTDYVRTYNEPEIHLLGEVIGNLEPDYGYDLNLDYFMLEGISGLYGGGGYDNWEEGVEYSKGETVLHQSMNWQASNDIPDFIPPPTGSINNNTERNGFYDGKRLPIYFLNPSLIQNIIF